MDEERAGAEEARALPVEVLHVDLGPAVELFEEATSEDVFVSSRTPE